MASTPTSNLLCDSKNSCLVIIDIQERLSAAIPEKVMSRLRKNTSILLNAANELSIPIIATAQYPKGLGQIETFVTDNLPDSSVQLEKTCFSCLGADGFDTQLKKLNKKQILLIGIESHICVLQSAFELVAEEYEVFVITDAVASRKLSSYEVALTRLNQGGVHLITTESVLFEWLRDASHSNFKTLSKTIL